MEDRKRYLKLLKNSNIHSFSDFTGTWKKLKINVLDSFENSWYNIKSGEIFNQGECVLLNIEVGPGRNLTSYQILNHVKDFLDQLEPEKYYAIICRQEVIPFRNSSKQCKIVPAGYGSMTIDLERVICPEVYFGQKEDDIRKEITITNEADGRLIIKTFIRDLLVGLYEFKEFEIVEISEEEYNKELWRSWKPLKTNPDNII